MEGGPGHCCGHGGGGGFGGSGSHRCLCPCSSILSSILAPALLLLIAEGNGKHGYELGPALEILGLDVSIEGGRLYRHLRGLEKEGLVESRWDTETQGPARRVYSITEKGLDSLQASVASVDSASRSLTHLAERIRNLGSSNSMTREG